MTRRRLTIALGAASSLLVLALVRGSGGGPALYDGICAPVTYTSMGASPGPLSASKAIAVGQSAEVATGEAAPQAQIILPANSFPLPDGTRVTVTITPMAPPPVPPSDGRLEGNVYAFSAAAPDGVPVDLTHGQPATIALEATAAGGPQLAVERFDRDHWTKLTTVQSGCGTTELANSPALGSFALVSLGTPSPGASPPPPADSGGLGAPVVIALVATILVGAGATVVLIRRRRR